jgi:hypothetical protein
MLSAGFNAGKLQSCMTWCLACINFVTSPGIGQIHFVVRNTEVFLALTISVQSVIELHPVWPVVGTVGFGIDPATIHFRRDPSTDKAVVEPQWMTG